MAIENRRNTKYYYRKHRINGRVVSEYVGRVDNPIVQLIARKDQRNRNQKAEKRLAWKSELEPLLAADQDLEELEKLTGALVKANLLLAGYHQHKGQWRKRREPRG